jgi:hypothetical protein
MRRLKACSPSPLSVPPARTSAKADLPAATNQPIAAQDRNSAGCVSRRSFLTALAGATGAAGLMPLGTGWAWAAPQAVVGAKTRVRLVFSHHRDDAQGKGDIQKLLTQWDLWGWHRVTFYGDHKLALSQMSALLGFKLTEEA